MWPLMLYEIATTTVEGFERVINRHLRRWLGVPPSFTSIGLYGRTNQLQLPMTSLVEEFKVAKGRLVVTLKESSDDMIWKAGIETRTGRKWSASQAVAQAESRLRHKDIVGTTYIGRHVWAVQNHNAGALPVRKKEAKWSSMRSGFQKRKTGAPEQSGWEGSAHGHNGRPQKDT